MSVQIPPRHSDATSGEHENKIEHQTEKTLTAGLVNITIW